MRTPCWRSTASSVPASPPRWRPPRACINNLFFDPRRYDLSVVGRYKFNKKLSLWTRIPGQKLAYPVADPRTGEILFDAGHVLTRDEARELDAIGVNEVTLDLDGKTLRVFSNNMVDLTHFVDFDPVAECGIKERVRFDVLAGAAGKVQRRGAQGSHPRQCRPTWCPSISSWTIFSLPSTT